MFSEIKSVHFVGVCGTAMASAAAALKEKGYTVTGSDQNVYPPMSTFLASRQIEVFNGYTDANLAHKPDLVVVGNAISRGNPEAEAVLAQKLRYCSLPELLKEFRQRAVAQFLREHGLGFWVATRDGIANDDEVGFVRKVGVGVTVEDLDLARSEERGHWGVDVLVGARDSVALFLER